MLVPIETMPHHDRPPPRPDRREPGGGDPFGCSAVRDQVLAAWAASPARFREDANAEEDLALGGYRDRLLVELAQNAADAAADAGGPGRLRLTLAGPVDGAAPVLVAANTGAPLTADGVQALATLRASAKRVGTTVGRFGVGFAAVLAVTDEPLILSRSGGVRFSRADTAALVDETARAGGGLAEEVRRRSGHVPALRLPFEAEGEPPEGFDTAVVLPLRDAAAEDLVRRLLAGVDDPLLLALPALRRIEVDVDGAVRAVEDAESRWHVHRVGGTFSRSDREQLLADRPTEERSRPSWSVLWALPRDGGTPVPGTVHAPTPTDEPVSLPALLLASFPLDPTRRHVATGPLTGRLVSEAATAYADLVHTRARDGADIGGLVPTGLPAGALDGALREAIVRRLGDTPVLPGVEEPTALIRPRDAVVLDGVEGAEPGLLRLLGSVVGGLVARPSGGAAVLDALGVRRLGLADLVDELGTVAEAHPPSWWHRLYAALAPALRSQRVREALGALPVPLADGQVVRGPRGLLVPAAGLDTSGERGTGGEHAAGYPVATSAVLAPYGMRLVHPDAAHETLVTLGATEARARTLLENGAVRAAVDDSPDADDPDAVAEAVLALVADATSSGDLQPEELRWLGDLALRDADGVLAPAAALVIPGSEVEAVLDPDEFGPVAGTLVRRWGVEVLEATGVLRTLGRATASDVDTDVAAAEPPGELADLDGVAAWMDAAPRGVLGEFAAVRDLDCVADDAWPRALQMIAARPELRQTLVRPARVRRPDGVVVRTVPYTAWWIRRHVRAGDVPLPQLSDPEAAPAVAALLAPAPGWLAALDPEVRAAIGLVRHIDDLGPEAVAAVLARLADETVDLEAATLREVWNGLAALDARVDPPERVRVLDGAGTTVVDGAAAVVVDAPMWLQRPDLGGFVVAPPDRAEDLADLLDLPLASERGTGRLDGGTPTAVSPAVLLVLPDAPARWWSHERLLVDGQEVDWWVDDGGRAHAASADGLARALAWSAGHWSKRHLVAAALAQPARAPALALEAVYDEVTPAPPSRRASGDPG